MRWALPLLMVGACRYNFDPLTGTADAPGPVARVTLVTTGAGTGTIAGLPCGACTSADVPVGMSLHFKATADGASWFRGWLAGCGGRQECDVVVEASGLTVVADFTARPNRLFVSSIAHDGDFGGVGAVADQQCAMLAAQAGLDGTWVIMLSSAAASYTQKLAGARGWIRVDGQPVADTLTDFTTTGAPMFGARLTELGVDAAITRRWSIGHASGAVNFCLDWTSNANTNTTAATYSSTAWLASEIVPFTCDQQSAFLCAEVGANVAVDPVPEPGRIAFVSSSLWDDTAGIANADALCTADATAASLPGNYLALLSTSTGSALSRFDLAGPPWVRVDGTALLPTAQAWSSASFFDAAPLLGPLGQSFSGWNIMIGGGPLDAPGTLATTCTDWSAATQNGRAMPADETQVVPGSTGCTAGAAWRLLCMQE